jgi:hypothetical protein
MEHVEARLAYRKLERLSGLGIGDRHRHTVLARVPQQADIDPVAGADDERAGAEGTATLRRPAVARSGLELGDPPLKEAALTLRACERERALERFARLNGPAEPAQQLRARRVKVLVVAELELLDDLERLLG